VEFRYHDKPTNQDFSSFTTKTVTIGVYDTIEEAVNKGNECIKELEKTFVMNLKDEFKVKGLWGNPDRLVCNWGGPIQFFAKIETLNYSNLIEVIEETLQANERYKAFKRLENND